MRDSDILVLEEVSTERMKQEEKWGHTNHCPADWLMILGEEVGEANKAGLEAKFHDLTKKRNLRKLRKELVQVAAVSVAFVQSLDRNELARR